MFGFTHLVRFWFTDLFGFMVACVVLVLFAGTVCCCVWVCVELCSLVWVCRFRWWFGFVGCEMFCLWCFNSVVLYCSLVYEFNVVV